VIDMQQKAQFVVGDLSPTARRAILLNSNMYDQTIAFQINILAQTSEVSKTSEVFKAQHFSENLYFKCITPVRLDNLSSHLRLAGSSTK
jgi:hypothetical protein